MHGSCTRFLGCRIRQSSNVYRHGCLLREMHGETGDPKDKLKSRICEAIQQKKEKVALSQMHQFFTLHDISVLDCNHILQECWVHASGRVAQSMWISMKSKQINMNTFSVACLLSALCRTGLLDEALELLYKLGSQINVQPNIVFCGIYLNGCSQAGSASHAEKCLRFINEKGMTEDELIYLELMKLAGKKRDLRAVHKAWSLMVKVCKPSMPSMESYSAAVKALCRAGSFREALTALREMVQLVSKNDDFTLISQRLMKIKCLYNDEDKVHLEEISRCRGTFIIKNGKGSDDEAVVKKSQVEPSDLQRQTSLSDSDHSIKNENVVENKSEIESIKATAEAIFMRQSEAKTSGNSNNDLDLQTSEILRATKLQDSGGLPYDQILGWTRLAMLNLQQSCSTSIHENLQSMGSPISGFFQDKYAKVKDILRETFNAIINTAVNRGDLNSAEVMFSQMRTVDLKPDIYSYNAMLRAVVRGRGLEKGFVVVKNMESDGVEPDTKTYNAIIEGFCLNLELDKAEALLERMLGSVDKQRPSTVSFNTILKACGQLDEPIRALRVFSKMINENVMPDRCTILYLLSTFGRINYPYDRGTEESQNELAQRLSAIESYMESANMAHNFQTFNAVMVALSAEGMVDAVIQRLRLAEGCVGGDGLPILTPITFNTAIHACNQARQWTVAKEILRRMKDLGLKPNTETYNVFIDSCAEQKKLGDAFQYFERMQEEGLKPTLYTYNSLIKVCCFCKKLDAAVSILKEIEEYDMVPSVVTFITLLSSAVHEERMDMVEFLIEHMYRKQIQPNITICELVVSAYLNCHQIDDAAEALGVLSTRMLPNGENAAGKMQDILKQICLEDSLEVESSTMELLKDALVSKGVASQALLAARLSGFGNVPMDVWETRESAWAERLRIQYDTVVAC